MKKIVKLPSISQVVAGSTASLQLPLGNTYEKLLFKATAAANLNTADIKRINVLIDGNVVQTYKNLDRLIAINGYYDRETDTVTGDTAIEFAIHFARAELLDNVWRKAPGFGTIDVQTFHIEIELADDAPADVNLTAHALVDPIQQKLGAFFRIREFPVSNATAGVFEVDKLPRGAWYSVIHAFKADISKVEVEANQVKIIDATKSILERTQKGASPVKRVPASAAATHIDMILDGNLLDSLQTANLSDFRLKLTLDTEGAVDVVTETLDNLVQA